MPYNTNFPPAALDPLFAILRRAQNEMPGTRFATHAEEPPLELTVNIEPKKTANKDVATAYYLFTTFNIVVALYHIVHFILKGSI